MDDGTVDDKEPRMLLGVDAVGLFPSLDSEQSGKIVGEIYKESGMKIENVNYKELSKYVALNLSELEIRKRNMHTYIPVRKHKFGPRPGIKTKEAIYDVDDDESLWQHRRKEFSREEEKEIMAVSLEIAVTSSFKLHTYTCGGKIYRQLKGGPIGSCLTMAVSTVVMLWWGKRLRRLIEEASLNLYSIKCYVDDGRLLVSLLELDVYSEERRKMWRKASEDEEDRRCEEVKIGKRY